MGTGTAAAVAGNQFSFTKSGQFLQNKVSANITLTADQESAALIAANEPFGRGTIHVASMKAGLSGGTGNLNFANDKNDVVSFSGSAAFDCGIGVYDDESAMLQDLDPQGSILKGLALNGLAVPGENIAQFVALDWGYNVSASASGSVALGGAASITFGADGSTDG